MEGMTLERLQVIIEAQTKAYYEELNKVQQQTQKTTNVVQQQTEKIKSALGKIGKVVAVAFSVTALLSFGKSCIELGSDLEEVQNVVDVTFGSMSETINHFARDALEQFGLSETSAKKYTSTLGAMLKSMGFTTSAAADMSMEMTGLAADMASFYNLDTDVAFEKIRSGISGETEPLKQLGINLSVANLEAYALSQGMTTAYSAMSQQEQALLRYNYLLSVTADAQGDFARTSDGWANQVRVLTERFNALKAAIGKGLIAVLTPVVRALNNLLAKILTVTDAFSNMIAKITGKSTRTTTAVKDIGGAADGAADSMGTAGAAADKAGKATDKVGKSTEKAGKAANKAKKEFGGLFSFDEIHSLNKNDDADSGILGALDNPKADGTGGTGGGGGAGGGLEESIVDAANEADGTLNPALEKIINRLMELKDLFKDGFKAGLGDVTLEPLKKAVEGIKRSLKEIWTDPAVLQAANSFLDSTAYSLGQQAGAVTSIGITIATNLVGGLDKYLDQNKERIKQHLVTMFDVGAEIARIQGDFAQAVANIFSVFGGENGQQATANLIGIVADAAMGINELAVKMGRDVLDLLTRPFIDNQAGFKEAIDGTLGVVSDALGSIKQVVDDTFGKANEVYDGHVEPMFSALASGVSSITGVCLNAYNTYILPVLNGLQEKVAPLIEEHIQPAIDKALELIGKIADAVSGIWQQILQPFIEWLVVNVAVRIAPVMEVAGSVFLSLAGVVADVVGAIFDLLGGLIDFIAGVFTGDFKKAGESIKATNEAIWEAVKSVISGVWSAIKTIVSAVINSVATTISTVHNSIKTNFSTVWNTIQTTVTTIINTIRTTVSTVMATIQTKISTVLNTIKTTFSTVWNAIQTTVTTIINTVRTTISSVMSAIQTGISTTLSSIRTGWNNTWENMKSTVIGIFNAIWSGIKGTINSIIGGVEKMANGVINALNGMINALNNLKFDVPDWVPGIGGKSFGLNISTLGNVSIPKLAKGGVVDRATIAMIGEAGKEAVVPLENNTGWIDKLAARIGEIISVNLMNIIGDMDGGDEWQTIHTTVMLDTKTLVEQEDKFRRRKGYQMAEA